MMSGGGSLPPPDFDSDASAFWSLVSSLWKSSAKLIPTRIVKKLDQLPEVCLPSATSRHKALALAERGLIGQFTGVWPSLHSMKNWVQRNW
jgi:hypothetical protein